MELVASLRLSSRCVSGYALIFLNCSCRKGAEIIRSPQYKEIIALLLRKSNRPLAYVPVLLDSCDADAANPKSTG